MSAVGWVGVTRLGCAVLHCFLIIRVERTGAGRVSRGSGPCSPSSPARYTLGSMDSHGLASAISAGVTRSGFVVSHGLRLWGWAGVTRSGSVIFMVSDHERQGLGGCRALGFVDFRGLRS